MLRKVSTTCPIGHWEELTVGGCPCPPNAARDRPHASPARYRTGARLRSIGTVLLVQSSDRQEVHRGEGAGVAVGEVVKRVGARSAVEDGDAEVVRIVRVGPAEKEKRRGPGRPGPRLRNARQDQGSVTSLRSIVTVPSSVRAPKSTTCTVRLKVGVVSKSNAPWLFTVTSPLEALIAKASFVFPPVML